MEEKGNELEEYRALLYKQQDLTLEVVKANTDNVQSLLGLANKLYVIIIIVIITFAVMSLVVSGFYFLGQDGLSSLQQTQTQYNSK